MRKASLILWIILISPLRAQEPLVPTKPGPEAAVICMPSHGCSATVIYSDKTHTLILGCGHAYLPGSHGENMRDKPMRFLITHPSTGPPIKVQIKLLKVDFNRDLSLVEMNTGPLPYVAPVAARGTKYDAELISVGYDNMQFPATIAKAHPLYVNGGLLFTREPPWHGRSGGGLLNQKGELVGVCSGYIKYPAGPGLYVSLDTIHDFLDGKTTKPTRPVTPVHPPNQPDCPT